MSLHWSFSAFPAGTFAQTFGRVRPAALTEFLALIEWNGTEGGGEFDIPAMQALARSSLTEGLNYTGRSPSTARQLDELVSMALSSEGQDALGLGDLSPGGIDGPDPIWATFGKRALGAEGSRVLRWLEHGRRWGTTVPCADVWGAHLVLTPPEVAVFLSELQTVIARGAAERACQEDVEELVLPELTSLASQGLELVGRSG